MKNPFHLFSRSILLIITLNFFLCLKGFTQDQHIIDSLKQVLAIVKQDTNKVKLLIELGNQYDYIIPDTSLFYFQKALDVSKNINAKSFTARCLRDIGNVYHDQGFYDKAIEYHLEAYKIFEELDIRRGVLDCYINIGNIYIEQGSYDKAIEYYLKALKIAEEIGNKIGISFCYGNIGLVHFEQGSYDLAIDFYLKSIKIKKELGYKLGIAVSYINIGEAYHKKSSYDKALEYYLKSLKIFEELGHKYGIANCYNNIGELHHDQGSYDQEIEYQLKSLEIAEEIGNKNLMAVIYLNIASLNITLADSKDLTDNQRLNYLNKAVEFGNKSIELAKEMEAMPEVNDAASTLMKAYKKLGKYKMAIQFAELFISTRDSMFREEKTKAIQEMATKYETEKNQQQIELQESQLVVKDTKIKQQKILRNALLSGLGAFIIIIILVINAYFLKRKSNFKIKKQNDEIEQKNIILNQQKEEITTQLDKIEAQRDHVLKQKQEITDSINYAQKIQSAILPPETYITELLHENFVFYRPRDIVSGDFYWVKQVKGHIILVAADCTGHGVPGAFMSMLGISYLNEIVQTRGITKANQILNELRSQIKHSLRQHGQIDESKDGMDIAICVIETKTKMMQYSGAFNPLYLIKDVNGKPKLLETKPDRMPVGFYHGKDKTFTNHEVQLEIGDTFYIFSDGFVDQFGGKEEKKYLSKNFKKLLLEIHDQPLYEQKEILDKKLKEWMAGYPQMDDILVIGVRG